MVIKNISVSPHSRSSIVFTSRQSYNLPAACVDADIQKAILNVKNRSDHFSCYVLYFFKEINFFPHKYFICTFSSTNSIHQNKKGRFAGGPFLSVILAMSLHFYKLIIQAQDKKRCYQLSRV